MPFISRGGVIAVALSAAALGGCSASVSVGKTVDTGKAEKLIGDNLTKQLGGKVTVDCPSDIKAKAGSTFNCTAKASDGETAKVLVTQKDDKGNISFALQGNK